MTLTNQLREGTRVAAAGDGSDESDDPGTILKNKFSIEDRVNLLSRTITQETFKRLQMALFSEDRQLTTYMLATRVQEAENFLEKNLFDFLMTGSKEISMVSVPREVEEALIPGMNPMAWADLTYLSSMKPFNRRNLLGHITQNATHWRTLCATKDGRINFDDLPNSDILDLRFFS
jgi:hypothetical protein